MSVLCNLIEIPQDLLDLFKIHREAERLYWRASNSREEPNIGSISKLSMPQREVVRELYPSDRHKIGKVWNLGDCNSVLWYKTYKPEEYLEIRESIPKIIEYGKTCNYLELGRAWHLVSFLFSGSRSYQLSDLVIWGGSSIGINPILYKKHILDRELSEYYLEVDEVKTLAELMQDFGDEIVCENLKQIVDRHRFIYFISRYKVDTWKDESSLSLVKDLCNSTKDFYCRVADRGNLAIVKIC